MQDTIYKVNNGIDYSVLKSYGFRKTEPKENPWWQWEAKVYWGNGIGTWNEGISISNKTGEVKVRCDLKEWGVELRQKVQKLFDDGLISLVCNNEYCCFPQCDHVCGYIPEEG